MPVVCETMKDCCLPQRGPRPRAHGTRSKGDHPEKKRRAAHNTEGAVFPKTAGVGTIGTAKGPCRREQWPLTSLLKQTWVPATASDSPGGVTKMLHSDVRRGSHISHGNAGAL